MPIDDGTLTLWQFADGLFPAGGFAHSFGLETYAQQGRVRDRASLEAFVVAHLEGAAGPCDAVAAATAARLAVAGDAEGLCALDARLDAMKCVPEFRTASVQMGRQTLRVAAALDDDAFLRALERAVDDGRTPGHHAVVFGAATGRGGADPERAAAAYLHSTCVLLIGAGLRLIQLGQLDGQRVLAAMRPRIARLAAAASAAGPLDMWSFTPALEIAGLVHATLDMRLFRS
ncbi:MAG: urease accessory protein UreF [Candidatus Rokuibacteriota bacterium]